MPDKQPKPLSGELALIEIAMGALRLIASYTPVSRIQPVMIARDALKRIYSLTLESEPIKQQALMSDALGLLSEIHTNGEVRHVPTAVKVTALLQRAGIIE